MKQVKNKKLIIRSGIIILLLSAIGGGVYFADQNNQPLEKEEQLNVVHPVETYIKTVYVTYSTEIVAAWNEVSQGNLDNIVDTEIKVLEWHSMIAEQDGEFEALNQPIEQQISILEEYLSLSNEDVSAEQRKRQRKLSADFVEGHQKVREGVLKILKDNDATYTVEEDGTIIYQFK